MLEVQGDVAGDVDADRLADRPNINMIRFYFELFFRYLLGEFALEYSEHL